MMQPQQINDGSRAQPTKLSSVPRQYVDVNDLRRMLKLALGLHSLGDPLKRLNKAMDGLARLAGADAWVAMVLNTKAKGASPVSKVFTGGKDAPAAQALATRIESDHRQAGTSVGKLFATPRQTPGRVLAGIERGKTGDGPSAIHSLLRPETAGSAQRRLTWISIHRNAGAAPFRERERRLVELFHSQSAWLLLQVEG